MQLLAYGEVVDRFGLDILKESGDFVLKDGDLALTKTGDIMLKNPQYHALWKLVEGWRHQAPTLQPLFDSVFSLKEQRKQLDERRNHVFENHRFDINAPNTFLMDERSIDKYHELNDQIFASEEAVEIYAGAVVLVINGLLLALKYEIDATRDDWEKSAPLIQGCSVGSIVAASANNFRHSDEWARPRSVKERKRQLPSIRVLSSAFQEAPTEHGAYPRFSRNVCPDVLELLSDGSFDELGSRMFTFAHNMAKRGLDRA